MIIRIIFAFFMLTWGIAVTIPVSAADLVVTRYFSGLWDQPKQESQGIMLQIIDQEEDGKKKAVAYWFTYGDNLHTAWYMGIGLVEGDQVVMKLYTAEGVEFMEEDAPGNEGVYSVGSLVLSFHNCNKGIASYDIVDKGVDEFEIKKLAGLYNSRCSGGISDDTPSDARPVKLEVDLLPAREDITGSGDGTFWERTDRSDFKVHVKGMPQDGTYTLKTSECDPDDQIEDAFEVVDGSGNVQYRSPESDGKRLLTFNPRDCKIEVLDSSGVALTSGEARLAEKENGNSGGDHGNGMMDITIELDNVSAMPEAEATAEYRDKNNSEEFEVEVERVLAGHYTLYIDHQEKGIIEVFDDANKTKGKIRFSDPQREERELLDFDVLGALIEVKLVVENKAGAPFFEGIFPLE